MITEERNPNTENIDILATEEMLRLINSEDTKVPLAIGKAIPQIAKLVDATVETLRRGGRLVYMGAGTSGRIGVVDAAEWPPTYGVGEECVVALIAGGDRALRTAVEGAEDDSEAATRDLIAIGFGSRDLLFGLSASGRTAYVLSGVKYARSVGATTAGLSCNTEGLLEAVDIPIFVDTGPEVIMGSTRMKAGTAEKMVLNAVSTSVMVKLGRVYKNYMVDLRPLTNKTRASALRMHMEITGVEECYARRVLAEAGYNVKLAVVMVKLHLSVEEARRKLEEAGGNLRLLLG
ncbi:MAG: N-acetylmuramic acid 6-phosphate etherase [Thermoprotei archaeon]